MNAIAFAWLSQSCTKDHKKVENLKKNEEI